MVFVTKERPSKFALRMVYYCQKCDKHSGTTGNAKTQFRRDHDHRTEPVRKEKPRK